MSKHRRRRLYRRRAAVIRYQRFCLAWDAAGGIDGYLALMYPDEAVKGLTWIAFGTCRPVRF